MTSVTFVEQLVGSLAYTGNAYAQLERLKFGSGSSHYVP